MKAVLVPFLVYLPLGLVALTVAAYLCGGSMKRAVAFVFDHVPSVLIVLTAVVFLLNAQGIEYYNQLGNPNCNIHSFPSSLWTGSPVKKLPLIHVFYEFIINLCLNTICAFWVRWLWRRGTWLAQIVGFVLLLILLQFPFTRGVVD